VSATPAPHPDDIFHVIIDALSGGIGPWMGYDEGVSRMGDKRGWDAVALEAREWATTILDHRGRSEKAMKLGDPQAPIDNPRQAIYDAAYHVLTHMEYDEGTPAEVLADHIAARAAGRLGL